MTHIPWSSDFALYLEDYLLYEQYYLSPYDPKFNLKINIGHYDLYFMVQWFCLILKTIWCMYIILWEYESLRLDVWPKN